MMCKSSMGESETGRRAAKFRWDPFRRHGVPLNHAKPKIQFFTWLHVPPSATRLPNRSAVDSVRTMASPPEADPSLLGCDGQAIIELESGWARIHKDGILRLQR